VAIQTDSSDSGESDKFDHRLLSPQDNPDILSISGWIITGGLESSDASGFPTPPGKGLEREKKKRKKRRKELGETGWVNRLKSDHQELHRNNHFNYHQSHYHHQLHHSQHLQLHHFHQHHPEHQQHQHEPEILNGFKDSQIVKILIPLPLLGLFSLGKGEMYMISC